MSDKSPSISLVTPSYNSKRFIEDTILSVLTQNYPSVEYIMVDGGSTDGTVGVIKKYEDRLQSWTSEPDGGMYDAINKGFARSTGELMGWLNSDDKHTPWTLGVVSDIFSSFPDVLWLTTTYPLHWDHRGRAVRSYHYDGFSREAFQRGHYLPGAGAAGWIQQESTFWRRSLWESVGGALSSEWKLAADYDLWARFYQHADLWGVATPLAGFRVHGDQKTAHQSKEYLQEAEAIHRRHGGRRYSAPQAYLRWKLRSGLPRKVRVAGGRVGLFPPRKVCTYADWKQGWTLETVW
jgi:glycosyltransferase involved in cell wall biosynthesis